MSEKDCVSIYVVHVQSANKIDESRNSSTRSYGALCAILVVANLGALTEIEQPIAAISVSILLILISLGWLLTLISLTAKLDAKHDMLCRLEYTGNLPIEFLTQEAKVRETRGIRLLQK